MVRGSVESLDLAGIFSTYPNPHINFVQAFAVEMVITAILMGVILALTDDGNGVPRGPLAPLLIGLLIAVIGASMGPLTGFAMNPARDIGPKAFAWLAGWGDVAFTGGKDIPYFRCRCAHWWSARHWAHSAIVADWPSPALRHLRGGRATEPLLFHHST